MKRENRKVVVQFAPTTVGPVTGSIEITTNDPTIPVVTILLSGEGK
ncbi:MAG: hypothetical protein ABI080_11285 [Candidatus Binatia bacterium]